MKIKARISNEKFVKLVNVLNSGENQAVVREGEELLNGRREFVIMEKAEQKIDNSLDYDVTLKLSEVVERSGEIWKHHRIPSASLEKIIDLLYY